MVKDIRSFGGANGHSWPNNYAEHNGKLYFAADGPGDMELWVTDGTETGTERVADIGSPFGSNPSDLVSCNGYLLFIARASFANDELWRSDGTEAGTVMVKDIDPSGAGLQTQPNTFERRLVKIGNTIYFSADDGSSGPELWKSDGTEAGTVMVKDASSDPYGYTPQNFAIAGDILYYKYNDGVHGQELWRSDGTEDGTFMVKDITDGLSGSFALPTYISAIDDRLFLGAAAGSTFNIELWKSDGTEAGTVLAADINPGEFSGSSPQQFIKYQDYVVFVAQAADGYELWRYSLAAPAPLAGQIQITSPLACFGDMDGALEVAVTGGQPPFGYEWDPSTAEGSAPSGLGAGDYAVTVTDSEGSTITFETELPEPPELTVSVDVTPETGSMMDGAVDATPNGGTPPYEYEWDTSPAANTATVSNLSAGEYTVTITDTNGCTVTETVEVGIIDAVNEALAAKFQVVPTLSKGTFSIRSEQPVYNMDVQLFDQFGRTVKRWDAVPTGQRLNAAGQAQGIYILKVGVENQYFAKRLAIIN